MREALIVSAVRTPVGKAGKGTLRATRPDDLAAIAFLEAIRRVPGLDPKEIDDVILGCAMPEGEAGNEHCAHRVPARGSAGGSSGHHHQPLLLFRPAIDRHGRRTHHGRPRRRDSCGRRRIHEHDSHGRQQNRSQSLADGSLSGRVPQHGPDSGKRAPKNTASRGKRPTNFRFASHQKALAAIAAGKFKDEIVPVEVQTTVVANAPTAHAAKAKTTTKLFRYGRRPARRYFARSLG